MFVYLLTALVGAALSCVLLWPYGVAVALVGMPLGGTSLTFLAAILFYMRSSGEARANKGCAEALD